MARKIRTIRQQSRDESGFGSNSGVPKSNFYRLNVELHKIILL